MKKIILFIIIVISTSFIASFRCIRSSSYRYLSAAGIKVIKKPFAVCWNDTYFSFSDPDMGTQTFKILNKTIDKNPKGQIRETFINDENSLVMRGHYLVDITFKEGKAEISINMVNGNGSAYVVEGVINSSSTGL